MFKHTSKCPYCQTLLPNAEDPSELKLQRTKRLVPPPGAVDLHLTQSEETTIQAFFRVQCLKCQGYYLTRQLFDPDASIQWYSDDGQESRPWVRCHACRAIYDLARTLGSEKKLEEWSNISCSCGAIHTMASLTAKYTREIEERERRTTEERKRQAINDFFKIDNWGSIGYCLLALVAMILFAARAC